MNEPVAPMHLLRSFQLHALVRLLVSLPLAAVLLTPGFVAGLRDGAPPAVVNNLDAFLVPLSALLAAATLGGALVSAGQRLRDAPVDVQRSAVGFAIGLAIGLALAIYAVVAWGLPLVSRHSRYPNGVTSEVALRVHPFLLTTPELMRVQDAFRNVGGFSMRVALTLELRAWLAASILVFALAAAVVMLARRPASRFLRVVAIEVAAVPLLFVACFLTAGPALLLNPHPRIQVMGWVVLGGVAVISGWRLRVALYPREAHTSITGQ